MLPKHSLLASRLLKLFRLNTKGNDMQLTMTGEYAVRAMVGLASKPFGTVTPISEISEEWEISENFLRKIIAHLVKMGLVHSRRGTNGGVRLAIPAEQLTLLDVIEAIEGKIFLNKCLIGPECCTQTAWCAVHTVWCEAQEAMRYILSKQSLAEIASSNAARLSHAKAAHKIRFLADATIVQAS
jgi:Rrf2 family protein